MHTLTPRDWLKRPDTVAVVVLFISIAITRLFTLTPNELGWDAFGYYLYLPATFIHHDPLLHDIGWIKAIQLQYGTTDSLYQITPLPDGGFMYFFLMGTALLYSPFFFIGHLAAKISGVPADGFSMPYQVAVATGCLAYTLIGLVLLRKILARYFTAHTAALVVLVLGFGTNYFHLNAIKSTETATPLFCLLAALVWFTIRWHEEQRRSHLLAIAATLALITLVKPSEATFGLVPLLWGVHGWASIKEKARLLGRNWLDLAIAIVLGLLILAPQLLLWRVKTGNFIFDSYVNPGIGLDWGRPHIGPLLFSFRKGWLIYTPVMAFALVGLVLLWRKQRMLFWPVAASFAVSLYVIASWTEWWHGGSFSCRPVVTDYVLLALPLGCVIDRLRHSRGVMRLAGHSLLTAFTALNLFQTWQHEQWILNPYRNTFAYYVAVFGRTTIPEGARDLLLVDRVFDAQERFTNEEDYNARNLAFFDMESGNTGPADHLVIDSSSMGHVMRMDAANPYSPTVDVPFEQITSGDHFWARASVRLLVPRGYEGELPCIVMTMQREGGNYGYRAFCAPDTVARDQWITVSGDFLTPEIREKEDRFMAYVWHRGTGEVLIDEFRITAFTPKD